MSADDQDTVAAPPVLRELQQQIDRALERELAVALDRLEGLSGHLTRVGDELRAFTASGKRVRPALLLLGYQAAGGQAPHRVEGPALALELLHTCALVHDDVIDRAATRRGRATVHRAFAAQHQHAGWPGDADSFGEAMAILVGDLAFVYADELFLQATVASDRLLAGLRRFTTLREEVMAGQTLDVRAAAAGTTDREAALTVATLKSGRYSVARPLEIGAILGGASAELVAALGAFGGPLGRAFQVRDDLLGVFGDDLELGKSTASDLVEGKRTLLIAEAVARLDPAGRTELLDALGDPTLDAARTARLRDLLESCGARRATESYVEAAVAEARRVLTELALPEPVAGHLDALATYLGGRST